MKDIEINNANSEKIIANLDMSAAFDSVKHD